MLNPMGGDKTATRATCYGLIDLSATTRRLEDTLDYHLPGSRVEITIQQDQMHIVEAVLAFHHRVKEYSIIDGDVKHGTLLVMITTKGNTDAKSNPVCRGRPKIDSETTDTAATATATTTTTDTPDAVPVYGPYITCETWLDTVDSLLARRPLGSRLKIVLHNDQKIAIQPRLDRHPRIEKYSIVLDASDGFIGKWVAVITLKGLDEPAAKEPEKSDPSESPVGRDEPHIIEIVTDANKEKEPGTRRSRLLTELMCDIDDRAKHHANCFDVPGANCTFNYFIGMMSMDEKTEFVAYARNHAGVRNLAFIGDPFVANSVLSLNIVRVFFGSCEKELAPVTLPTPPTPTPTPTPPTPTVPAAQPDPMSVAREAHKNVSEAIQAYIKLRVAMDGHDVDSFGPISFSYKPLEPGKWGVHVNPFNIMLKPFSNNQ